MTVAPLVTLSFEYYGYSGTILLLGGLMLHLFVSAALFRPVSVREIHVHEIELDKERSREEIHSKDDDVNVTGDQVDQVLFEQAANKLDLNETESEVEKQKEKKSVLTKHLNIELLVEKEFLSFCFLMIGIFMCFACRNSFMSLHAKEKHIEGRHFALILLAESVSDLVGRLTSGILFDIKTIKKRRILLFSLFTLIVSSMMFVLPFSYNFTSFISVVICRAVFLSAVHAQHLTILSDLVGSSRLSSAIGLSRVSLGIGYLIGPTVGGNDIILMCHYCKECIDHN